MVYDVAHDGIEDGIAKKFQPLVVDGLAFLAAHDALVHQGLLVVFDVFGEESQDVVNRQIKLLLLAEREPYSADEVIQHIS